MTAIYIYEHVCLHIKMDLTRLSYALFVWMVFFT